MLVHLSSTPVQYTCLVHLSSTPVQYTCRVHLFSTPVQYTCLLHLSITPVQYTRLVHLSSTPVLSLTFVSNPRVFYIRGGESNPNVKNPRSGTGPVPGQVQKVQGLRTKDLDLGLTLNLVCHHHSPPPTKLFLGR